MSLIINTDLSLAFLKIAQISNLSPINREVAIAISNSKVHLNLIKELALAHNYSSEEAVKIELLDLVLHYIFYILEDHEITSDEVDNVKRLKMFFKIKGDMFYRHKSFPIKEIIFKQIQWMYRNDDKISNEEALQKVYLQGIFDLSYDQFNDFNKLEVYEALRRGADLKNLDTVYFDKDNVS